MKNHLGFWVTEIKKIELKNKYVQVEQGFKGSLMRNRSSGSARWKGHLLLPHLKEFGEQRCCYAAPLLWQKDLSREPQIFHVFPSPALLHPTLRLNLLSWRHLIWISCRKFLWFFLDARFRFWFCFRNKMTHKSLLFKIFIIFFQQLTYVQKMSVSWWKWWLSTAKEHIS